MKNIEQLFIRKNAAAKSIMKKIDTNGWGIVFVVDNNNVLKGVVTPGDIRRALNNGFDINAPVAEIMNKSPLTVKKGQSKIKITQNVLKYIEEHEEKISEQILYLQIPVINEKKQIVDILSYSQTKNNISLNFQPETPNVDSGIRRVLIIGGAGYLGSIISRLLLKKGYIVRVLDVLKFGDTSISDLYNDPNFELIKGDVRNIQTMHESLENVDSVIHLAAIVGDPASTKYPQETIATNYLATMTLALACKYYQINKFIFASTCSVYGVGSKRLDESSDLNPVSLYARTKIESEKAILSLADENFKPIIMRMSTLYGYSPRMRFDLVVNIFAKMATTKKQISIFGGDQWRPLLHVADAAQAYVSVLEKSFENIDNTIFNVGTNQQNFTIKQIGDVVKKVLPNTKVELHKAENSSVTDKRTYQVSFDKIEKELGFTAKHTISDAISEINIAIKNGDFGELENESYYNCVNK
ncbi:MAG: hypothetical protein BroJett025_04840 [Patescibacteria group bacterium]|nr:MAG: hypothetical protein BroJett025_04840 [Patescibacteria group bacterium]